LGGTHCLCSSSPLHYKYNLQNKKPESKNRRLPPPANDDYFINRAIKIVDLDGWQNGWFWFVWGGFLRGD
jgi:hypothetical protein